MSSNIGKAHEGLRTFLSSCTVIAAAVGVIGYIDDGKLRKLKVDRLKPKPQIKFDSSVERGPSLELSNQGETPLDVHKVNYIVKRDGKTTTGTHLVEICTKEEQQVLHKFDTEAMDFGSEDNYSMRSGAKESLLRRAVELTVDDRKVVFDLLSHSQKISR